MQPASRRERCSAWPVPQGLKGEGWLVGLVVLVLAGLGLIAGCGQERTSNSAATAVEVSTPGPGVSAIAPMAPKSLGARLDATYGPRAARPTSTPLPTATVIPTPTPAPVLGVAPAQNFSVTEVVLPRDDGPHSEDIEWWYFNGHLEGANGNRYGFHYVFFKAYSSWTQTYALLGHLAVSDGQRGSFSTGLRLGIPSDYAGPGFKVATGGWSMSGYDGRFALTATLEDYFLLLGLEALKPPVLHAGSGLVDMGAAGMSYYYSYPRLVATGTLSDRGVKTAVKGIAWMDHQWGDLTKAEVGWDWFAIQLDDNSEIMFVTLRGSEGDVIFAYGTEVDENGGYRNIEAGEVTVRALGNWHSDATNTDYPSGWSLDMEDVGLKLTIAPSLADSEFHVPGAGLPAYWEGEATVEGTRNGARVTGQAFVELVGYASSFPVPGATSQAGTAAPAKTPVLTPIGLQ